MKKFYIICKDGTRRDWRKSPQEAIKVARVIDKHGTSGLSCGPHTVQEVDVPESEPPMP